MRIHDKKQARLRRQRRVRAKVKGSAERPRLSVFRSLNHIYAQVIDDAAGRTVCAASDANVKKTGAGDVGGRKAKVAEAFLVGKVIAELAKKAGLEAVVFDRNGFTYSGRVAALADGAREGGLKF
jgi:large subunit ribosomal protein L18